jgi:hypothetical protein
VQPRAADLFRSGLAEAEELLSRRTRAAPAARTVTVVGHLGACLRKVVEPGELPDPPRLLRRYALWRKKHSLVAFQRDNRHHEQP